MRSGRTGVLLLALIPAPLSVAGDVERDEALRALHDQAAAIQSWVESAERPAWLDANMNDAGRAAGEDLGRQQRERFREGLPTVSACRDLGQLCPDMTAGAVSESSAGAFSGQEGSGSSEGGDQGPDATALRTEDIRLTVLVSRSLGAAQLEEIFAFAFAADTPRVRVVFRGVAEDESLVNFVRQIHSLLAGMDPVPEVVLDPTPFAAAGIDIAPVLLAEGPDGELARVAGLADPLWLRARVLAGERGDLGVRGPVKAVTEPDLIEELQRRLTALDLEKLREHALERYWQRVAFEELPVAVEPRMREIDPTITAPRDVHTADGTLLVRDGETVNPLDRLPFTQRLVVFDAGDERQVATAKRLGRQAGDRRVTYLATRLERRLGWEGLTSVEDDLDAPVYLLTPDVRQRFSLERVPAFVEARGNHFLVAEVPPEAVP
jgi:conjugal transfer pilus assembly protein TraW